MSACMRSLNSSDQRAPGFPFALLCACGRGGVLLSLADFRAATFNLSVTRDDVELEGEFELFMRFLDTYFSWLNCSYWHAPLDLSRLDINIEVFTVRQPAISPRVQILLYLLLVANAQNCAAHHYGHIRQEVVAGD
jgi:hypothetical protein